MGPNLVQDRRENVTLIKQRMMAAQSRQKSYADKQCGESEFEVRDKVILKVSPIKGVKRFKKKRQMSPHVLGHSTLLKRWAH